jgi:hypothetical protein
MEQIFVESIEKYWKEVPIWRLCLMVSQMRKNTSGQNSIKDGLVHLGYNIAYPIIFLFLFLLTILNQT